MNPDDFPRERGVEAKAFARVAERVLAGGRLLAHWPLRGGVSASVHALEIAGAGGEERRVVVRRLAVGDEERSESASDAASREHDLLVALRRLGMAVPEVYLFDDSGEALPTPYLVMELVNGTTTVDDRDLPRALRQMAAFLAELHALDLESSRLPALPELEDPAASLPAHLPPGGLAANLRSLLPAATERRNPASLLHGDYWPGNLLWRDGRLVAVVDWEDATYGDPLSDLACCRVELLCQYGEAAMEAFSAVYLDHASGIDPTDLPLWEVYVSAAALSSMSGWGLPPAEEERRRARTQAFMERAARALLTKLE